MLTLPSPDDIGGIAEFAESFDGYEWCGSVLAAARLARARPRRSLEDLRSELFFEFRASRHADDLDFVDVYRELMWHFLRIARETNIAIQVSATPKPPTIAAPKNRFRTVDANHGEREPLAVRCLASSPSSITNKTYLELQKEIETLKLEADRRRCEEAVEILARIKAAIALYGFTAADLGLGGRAKESDPAFEAQPTNTVVRGLSAGPAPKYGDDKGNVWSGRGPRPAWFRQAIAEGKKPDDLLKA